MATAARTWVSRIPMGGESGEGVAPAIRSAVPPPIEWPLTPIRLRSIFPLIGEIFFSISFIDEIRKWMSPVLEA